MKNLGGRPQIDISKTQFENLCKLQCTKEEIASWFNCSEDTIDRWCKRTYGESFAVVFKQKRGVGKISLRRSQFRMAQKNPTMAIWLGKQYLGQRDQQDITVSDRSEDTIKRMDEFFSKKEAEDKEETTDND